jgi:hypothetical protein
MQHDAAGRYERSQSIDALRGRYIDIAALRGMYGGARFG